VSFEPKDNSASLFKNDKKEKDSDADYNGSGMFGGKEFWLNAWINEAKNGRKYLKLSFKPKDSAQKTNGKRAAVHPSADWNDDIPFA
jgi:hypothetical protein